MAVTWIEPSDVCDYRIADLRKRALAVMGETAHGAVRVIWGATVPERALNRVLARMDQGLRAAVANLTAVSTSDRFQSYWRPHTGEAAQLPDSFMPPEGLPPALPKCQLQSYRWTANLVAFSIWQAAEVECRRLLPADDLPTFTRLLQNRIYQVLLAEAAVAWELSSIPRYYVEFAHAGLIKLPPGAG